MLSRLLILRKAKVKSGRIVSKKFKGAKGKRDEKRGANGEKEVELFIGLVEWNESQECLKRKHEKRMALKVKKDDSPAVLLQKAYLSHCYDANEDYVLLLKDFKKATFLPGSIKKFFTLERYQSAALTRKFFADSQFHR